MLQKVLAVLMLVVMMAFPAAASSDPGFDQQWALARIQGEAAWSQSTGSGATVAVVDTGVAGNHEDLGGKVAGSIDCLNDPCVPGGTDDNGHGTAVAGIIAATANNSVGIAGVAPGARVLAVKVLDAEGAGELSDVIRGIKAAADSGAAVINLSLAGEEIGLVFDVLNQLLGGDSQAAQKAAFQEAINYASGRGSLVVAAAGNSGLASFYSGMQNVYVVGASGPEDQAAPYSSEGAEIMAPGGISQGGCNPSRCVLTTRPGGYAAVQGTSFAAPHVSGAAAVLKQLGLSNADIIGRINATADQVAAGRRLNLARAAGGGSPGSQAAANPGGAESTPRPGSAAAPRRTPGAAPLVPPVPLPVVEVPVLVLGSATSPSPVKEAGAGRSSSKVLAEEGPQDGTGATSAATILVLLAAGANGAFVLWRRRWS